jgi:phosphatidylglycerophosphate synthase
MLRATATTRRARAVRSLAGPTVGLACQFGLLAGLTRAPGVHVAGWVTGAGFALITWALLCTGLRRSGSRSLGPANRVTLARAVLVGAVAALAADSVTRAAPVTVVVTLSGIALLLDAVDGQVARRTRSTSALGARFDMEVDAFLILALCLVLVRPFGPWVLAIGAMRYAFVAAGRLVPWLTAPLPPRFSRKVVAAVQGVVLVVVVADVLAPRLAIAVLQAALVLLSWSFARDLVWLARSRDLPVLPRHRADGPGDAADEEQHRRDRHPEEQVQPEPTRG